MAERTVRLLMVASHPVQYASPQFRSYAQAPRLGLTVAYCSLAGSEDMHDPDFGETFAWDVPLLDGYRWRLVPNRSPKPRFQGAFGLMNPGLWRLIRRERFDVIVV